MAFKSTLAALALALVAAPSSTEAAVYRNVVYFMEWGIYGRNFNIFDMDWSTVSHVIYAFARPNADGTISLVDAYADTDKRWPDHGDSWNDQGTNLYGNFGQGFKQKLQHRGAKFGLSLGGWTMSDKFHGIASTEESRRTFAQSAVQLMLDLGLDFIDVDWEYPEGENDMPHFVDLLAAIRTEYKTNPNVSFEAELSVASPAGPAHYGNWDFGGVCGQVDFINAMTYDLAGPWSQYTDHQTNLYVDPTHPDGPTYSVDGAIQDYIQRGCPSEKIVMGISLDGRSFENTDGLYASFTAPTQGSWLPGGESIWDYKVLPLNGATEMFDETLVASYSYDADARLFMSYESPTSFAVKLDYVTQNNLGGVMFWSVDADAAADSGRSLIKQAYDAFGGSDNEAFYSNSINYTSSKYDNIRNPGSP
ncbi:Aste57867_17108 [Aphanomyces stellatus]|uniref:Aste57867_17108 protein n=1 Tax=Aphanomyces stellatus TaxID=120398 RepID=A0A485L708_9STRA|nr:hypothetical protein As57867_017049 [Aphanomyces stellatus]VFT93866.1 Aste57867_17108 [Aphanomyces stellatus]